MNLRIRHLKKTDQKAVIDLMREFYSSEAVSTNGSDEIFLRDINECTAGSPYVEGYVFEINGEIVGYAMLAKSFCTEFGKRAVWIEDIFIKKEYRSQKIGSQFIEHVIKKYDGYIIRLEVEKDNQNAIALYEKHGFTYLPYSEMKRE